MSTSTQAQETGTVMAELMRLNKIIADCENTLRLMERIKVRRKIPQTDFEALQSKLDGAVRERDWLEAAICRHSHAP